MMRVASGPSGSVYYGIAAASGMTETVDEGPERDHSICEAEIIDAQAPIPRGSVPAA